MPTYSYLCPSCERRTDEVRTVDERDTDRPRCICDRLMVRVPSSPAFTVQGFSAKNGYSKSRDESV